MAVDVSPHLNSGVARHGWRDDIYLTGPASVTPIGLPCGVRCGIHARGAIPLRNVGTGRMISKFAIFALFTLALLSSGALPGARRRSNRSHNGSSAAHLLLPRSQRVGHGTVLPWNFLASIIYLITRKPAVDAFAVATAEVGVVFCTVVLLTGPIWARPVWGIWWTWDARLTSTLVLWLIYIGYLMLRAFDWRPKSRARGGIRHFRLPRRRVCVHGDPLVSARSTRSQFSAASASVEASIRG